MEPFVHRFEVRQSPNFFPKISWPYLLILAILYYGAVVFELKLLLVGLMSLVLVFLLIREKAAAKCVLYTDQEKLKAEYAKGIWGVSLVSVEYFWKDLETFRYKPSPKNIMELHLKWKIWEDSQYSGKDLDAFRDYLRQFFPEKEQQ